MKIYLNSYKPNEILEKVKKSEIYLKKIKNHIEIISETGIYKIENKNVYKLHAIDKPILNLGTYKNAVLLLDKSYYEKEQIYSQLPVDHNVRNITIFYYDLHKDNSIGIGKKNKYNPNIQLVIEGYYKENQQINLSVFLKNNSNCENNSDNKYNNFIPLDFYFLVKNNDTQEKYDNNDNFYKEEVNNYLSLLF